MFHNSQAVLALSKEPEPDGVPEDARAQRLLLRRRRRSSTRWGTSRWSASPRRTMYRGEKPLQTKLAPRVDAATRSPARGRLLALHRGPAAAREPRDAAPATAASRSATRRPTTSPSSGCCSELKSMLGHLGMHQDHLIPRHAYLKNEIPVAGVRPPGRHLPVRHRSGDVGARTPTAARTRSTTSTSSTRASSRASAR